MCRLVKILLVFLAIGVPQSQVVAAEKETPNQSDEEAADHRMNNDRLQKIIRRVDPEYTGQPGHWQLRVANVTVRVITDQKNDRMRIVIPIRKADELSEEELYRVLQANYDTALDARYAIAQNILWGTFIHPFSTLTDEDFLSGLGQTINIATTYGETYSSGVLSFGGGDSGNLIEKELIEELKRGKS